MKQDTLKKLPKFETFGANLQQNKLIRLPQVMAMTGKSKSSLYMDVKAGLFPPIIKIGERASAWSLIAVQKWIDEKIEQSQEVA